MIEVFVDKLKLLEVLYYVYGWGRLGRWKIGLKVWMFKWRSNEKKMLDDSEV